MSIAVLVQVHDEVRRLAIAGGAVASGDFRLKKLVPPLEQAGAKAPVFDRVAKAAQAVVESDGKTASAALLDLASLVNSILYTQGETGIAGELAPLETTDLGVHETLTSARVLKPLLDSLHSTGSGRIELVREAVDRGTFKDLRLVKPALKALDDPYGEMAELITEKVLPMYGKAIVPELRATVDVKLRGGHLHRLRLLHKLDPDGSRDIVRRALDDGSKEMRVTAIECLGTTGEDVAALLEHATSKAKDVRSAALHALCAASTPTPEIVATLKRAIEGEALTLFLPGRSTLAEVREHLVAETERQFLKLLATKDLKQQGTIFERLTSLLLNLEGRTDGSADALFVKCLDAAAVVGQIKSVPSGKNFNSSLGSVIASSSPKMRMRLAAACESLPPGLLLWGYAAARGTMPPASFFENFSPLLSGLDEKLGKKGIERERAVALVSVLTAPPGSPLERHIIGYGEPASEPGSSRCKLDERWLDAAIAAGEPDLVCSLARPGHAKLNQFLTDRLATRKALDAHDLIEIMVRIGHPGAADAIIEAIKKQKVTPSGYFAYWHGSMIPKLPKSEVPKFEALLPTLPEKLVDQLLESIAELKNKPD